MHLSIENDRFNSIRNIYRPAICERAAAAAMDGSSSANFLTCTRTVHILISDCIASVSVAVRDSIDVVRRSIAWSSVRPGRVNNIWCDFASALFNDWHLSVDIDIPKSPNSQLLLFRSTHTKPLVITMMVNSCTQCSFEFFAQIHKNSNTIRQQGMFVCFWSLSNTSPAI